MSISAYIYYFSMSIYTYIHILFLSTRKTFSTPFRNFSSFSISILTPASRCLRSGEMSNTLKERERIINSQGCVRKKKEREKENERDISRDARRNVSFLRFPNPRCFICFTRRRPVIISRDKLLLRPPCMRVSLAERHSGGGGGSCQLEEEKFGLCSRFPE